MSDVREAVEKAFDSAPTADPKAATTPAGTGTDPGKVPTEIPTQGAVPIVADKDPGADKPVAPAPVIAPETPILEELKAPNFWKPEAKAHWDKLPKEVQQEALRRERESDAALSKSATARKFHQEFSTLIQPHLHTMAAEGVEPMVAINNLLAFATNLRSGTPVQKAALVAELVKNYSIDIATLDQMISGNISPEIKGQSELEKLISEKLKPVEGLLSQVEQARLAADRRVEEKAAAEIEHFAASVPHFDILSDEIADILDVAAKRGRTMTLESAYKAAMSLHPELSSKQTTTPAGPTPAQVAAGGSVSGAPARTPATPVGNSVREAVEAAFAAQER